MSAALVALLSVLAQIAPSLGSSSTITAIINALVQIIPVLVQEVEDVVPMVKNIIAALSANPAATADQLATLQTLDAQVDAAFEAAATAAQAEDAAAGNTTT